MLDREGGRIWICLSSHPGDIALARANLQWLHQLCGRLPHGCLLTLDHAVSWSDASDLIQLAQNVFQRVEVVAGDEPWEGWPAGPNYLFRLSAQYLQNRSIGPWFFYEPDCFAIKPDFLDQLEAAYRTAKTLFMGAVMEAHEPNLPQHYMAGVGVYPHDAWKHMEPAWDDSRAFDVATARVVVPMAAHTPLIQHYWGIKDLPPVFAETKTKDSPKNTFTLENLNKEAVVFHRTKGTSLIELLGFIPTPEDISFFQMGRYGDIILLLPAFKEWATRIGHPVTVFTSTEFGNVFEGVSYVQPVLLKQDWWHQTKEALTVARRRCPDVIRTQLHGAGVESVPDNLASFSLSMWDRAGLLPLYKKLPLVFDRRNPLREMVLLKKVKRTDKPLLLYNVNSWTSHLATAPELTKAIKGLASRFEIVDIGSLVAARIFDLLGLFDVAAGLVTIDTASLHLAAASKMPYIAIVRDEPPQSGSIPKGNCVLKVGYGRVLNKLSEITSTIEGWA